MIWVHKRYVALALLLSATCAVTAAVCSNIAAGFLIESAWLQRLLVLLQFVVARSSRQGTLWLPLRVVPHLLFLLHRSGLIWSEYMLYLTCAISDFSFVVNLSCNRFCVSSACLTSSCSIFALSCTILTLGPAWSETNLRPRPVSSQSAVAETGAAAGAGALAAAVAESLVFRWWVSDGWRFRPLTSTFVSCKLPASVL